MRQPQGGRDRKPDSEGGGSSSGRRGRTREESAKRSGKRKGSLGASRGLRRTSRAKVGSFKATSSRELMSGTEENASSDGDNKEWLWVPSNEVADSESSSQASADRVSPGASQRHEVEEVDEPQALVSSDSVLVNRSEPGAAEAEAFLRETFGHLPGDKPLVSVLSGDAMLDEGLRQLQLLDQDSASPPSVSPAGASLVGLTDNCGSPVCALAIMDRTEPDGEPAQEPEQGVQPRRRGQPF